MRQELEKIESLRRMFLAAKTGDAEQIKLLLQTTSLPIRDSFPRAFEMAIYAPHPGAFLQLLSVVDPQIKYDGWSIAEMVGIVSSWPLAEKKTVLAELAKKGVSLSPVHYAACMGDIKSIKEATKKQQDEQDSQGNVFVHYLSANGHLEILKDLDIRVFVTRNKHGSTALLTAANAGHLPVVQWILQLTGGAQTEEKNVCAPWGSSDAQVEKVEKDNQGNTPLLCAAEGGRLSAMKWLLQPGGGARIDEKDNRGCTALLIAAEQGHLPVVKFLLQEGGARIDEKDSHGCPPLLVAAEQGHLPIVQFLLQSGCAWIDEKNREGNTALTTAALGKRWSVVQWILRNYDISDLKEFARCISLYGNEPYLDLSRIRLSLSHLQILLDTLPPDTGALYLNLQYTQLSDRDLPALIDFFNGSTFPWRKANRRLRMLDLRHTHISAAGIKRLEKELSNREIVPGIIHDGSEDSVKELGNAPILPVIVHNSSANSKEESKATIPLDVQLFEAVEKGNLEALKRAYQLVTVGASIKDAEGNSLLHRAAKVGANEAMLSFLIKTAACELNGTNIKKETPLYLAVMSNQLGTVDFLLKQGADCSFSYPQGNDKESIYGLALRTGRSSELLRHLLSTIMRVDNPCQGDRSPPINLAARYGQSDAIRYLVKEKHARLDAQNGPLHEAAVLDQEEAVTTLLEEGAEFDADSPQGKELLKQVTSEKIRGRLNNHHAPQKRRREQAELFSQAIFLALFADVLGGNKKKSQDYPHVLAMIRMQLGQFPDISLLTSKIAADKLVDEKKQTPQEHQLTTFLRQHLIPRAYQEKTAKTKWLEQTLERETKSREREQLGEHLKTSLQELATSSQETVWRKNIVKAIVQNLELSRSKLSAESLERWLNDILAAYSEIESHLAANLALSKGPSEREKKLIEFISEEVNFSLKEDGELRNVQRDSYYRYRIQAGIDRWLVKNPQLLGAIKREVAYRIADDVTRDLKEDSRIFHEHARGMKPKKVGLALTLIKEVLLKNELLWDELLNQDDKANQDLLTKQLFSDLKTDRKTPFGPLITRSVDRLLDFTTDQKAFKLYESDVGMSVQQWLLTQGYAQGYGGASHSIVHSKYSFYSPRNIAENKEETLTLFEINKRIFIKTFLAKFAIAMGKFEALDKGMVRRNLAFVDELKDASKAVTLPDLKLDGVTLPCNSIKDILATVGVFLEDRQVAKTAHTVMTLFEAHDHLERLEMVKHAAEFIVQRYAWQIERLQADGAINLAVCGANRALQYITDPKNLCVKAPGFIDKMKAWFWPKVPSRKPEYVGPCRAIITGVLYGRSPDTDNYRLSTQDLSISGNNPWVANALLENTGLLVIQENGERQCWLAKDIPLASNGEPNYGYCLASDDERIARDYNILRSAKTPSDGVKLGR